MSLIDTTNITVPRYDVVAFSANITIIRAEYGDIHRFDANSIQTVYHVFDATDVVAITVDTWEPLDDQYQLV